MCLNIVIDYEIDDVILLSYPDTKYCGMMKPMTLFVQYLTQLPKITRGLIITQWVNHPISLMGGITQ